MNFFSSNFGLMTDLYRQKATHKSPPCIFVVMGFVIKVLWQDNTFVMKCTVNALCLMILYLKGKDKVFRQAAELAEEPAPEGIYDSKRRRSCCAASPN